MKSSNRITLTRPIIASRADAESALGDIALLTIERNETRLALDRELTDARERYEGPLAALGKQIEQHTALLEQWAAAAPEEFGKLKSIEMQHGRLGYRTGTPKLKTVMRKTWDAVLELIRAAGFLGFIRTKEEVNKELIISAAQQGQLTPEQLRAIGVKVEQDEIFFVEPKLEPLENRTAVASAA